MRLFPLIALAGLGAGAWWALQQGGYTDSANDFETLFESDAMIDSSKYANLPAYLAVQPIIAAAAAQYSDNGMTGGQPGDLLDNLLYQESTFNPNAKSLAGAEGIAQFEPPTAAQYGVNVWDVTSSINGAAAYLNDLYNMFGDWDYAVAAYNGGPGTVQQWLAGTRSLKPETVTYVARITGAALSA